MAALGRTDTREGFPGGSGHGALHRLASLGERWPLSWRRRLAVPTLAAALAASLLYFAAAVGSIYVARKAGGALFFPPTAILFVTLVRSRRSTWLPLLALAAMADIGATLTMGGQRTIDVLTVCVANMMESYMVARAGRMCPRGEAWFLSVRSMVRFALWSAAAAMAASSLFTAVLFATTSRGLDHLLGQWVQIALVDGLSLIMIGSLLLCWTEAALRVRLTGRRMAELGLGVATVGLISHVAFAGGESILFLVFPLLALLTVRTGLLGATIAGAVVAGVGGWDTATGNQSFAAVGQFLGASPALRLQLCFLGAVLSTLPIAVTLALREKQAEDQLRREHEISRAALHNMAEGLCMFDEEDRLITCNPQYAEIHELPGRLVLPGTPYSDILNHQLASGTLGGAGDGADAASEGAEDHREITLRDGRTIDVRRRALDGGGWIATYVDVTESRRAANQIAYLARHDPLTGLPNRAHFQERLNRALANAKNGRRFALHCLDLDRFKAVNDTMGHSAGDELLKEVAERLREVTKEEDLIARLGGDEFAILQLSAQSKEDAGELAAAIVESLGMPYQIGGNDLITGTSVGVAVAPDDSCEIAELLQKADFALYRAKAAGRGSYRFFEPGMASDMRQQQQLEVELRSALNNRQFELHFQPIFDTGSQAIESFEALLRWRHPIRGLLEPAEFMTVAEESGLIMPIGEWVIREGCRHAATWPESVRLAVNISPVQFKDRRLVTTIANALARSGLDPKRLEIEVTESVMIDDAESVLKTLKQLHELGIGISMDDFGTGYSNLGYLRDFPFTNIKIDKSFVKDIEDSECRAIVHATVELSANLGISITAEGVETARQVAILEEEGCRHLQGFYIGKPLPASRVLKTIEHFGDRRARQVLRKSA